ncbi:protein YIPF5 [Anthonomus grandis grandis]|uniref:protein YIPF5 n=1 Tax=Anthonomus grandis grandis TaxID=2921223 RepID=UPI002166BBEA|nr:protein YIPF5 [Anthonomus grandis grandis]
MGDFSNPELYWNKQAEVPLQQGYYEQDYQQFSNQQLDFKSNEEYTAEYANQSYGQPYPTSFYNPNDYEVPKMGDEDLDEPPLLEELEIYPDRILEKVLAVLNPLRGHSLADDAEYLTKDADLAGPVFFCLALAMLLLLAGKSQSFGYIYGFSTISCVLTYCLLSLMTSAEHAFTLSTVASILGYCLIPIVGLSFLGVFFKLSGTVGIILAAAAVFWASFSASRLFVAVSGDKQQQPLIMYPSALVYGVFVLLVLF